MFAAESSLTQKSAFVSDFASLNSARVTRLLSITPPAETDISWKQRNNILLVTELEQLFSVGFPVPLLIKTHAENGLSPSNDVDVYIQQSENE